MLQRFFVKTHFLDRVRMEHKDLIHSLESEIHFTSTCSIRIPSRNQDTLKKSLQLPIHRLHTWCSVFVLSLIVSFTAKLNHVSLMLSILLHIGPIANAHGENCILGIKLKQFLAVIVVCFDELLAGF